MGIRNDDGFPSTLKTGEILIHPSQLFFGFDHFLSDCLNSGPPFRGLDPTLFQVDLFIHLIKGGEALLFNSIAPPSFLVVYAFGSFVVIRRRVEVLQR